MWWVIANRNYGKLKKESQENLASLFSKTSELNKSNSNSSRLLNFVPNNTSLCCLFFYIYPTWIVSYSHICLTNLTLWHISMFKIVFLLEINVVHVIYYTLLSSRLQFPLFHSPLKHGLGFYLYVFHDITIIPRGFTSTLSCHATCLNLPKLRIYIASSSCTC